MFSRENTQALKGFAAIGIILFHIQLGFNISPIFNWLGGLFVAIFLIPIILQFECKITQKSVHSTTNGEDYHNYYGL